MGSPAELLREVTATLGDKARARVPCKALDRAGMAAQQQARFSQVLIEEEQGPIAALENRVEALGTQEVRW